MSLDDAEANCETMALPTSAFTPWISDTTAMIVATATMAVNPPASARGDWPA